MSEEVEQRPQIGPKKHLSKEVSIAVMVAGGMMVLIPWFFFPAEQGSALQIVKTLVGVTGFVAICVGAYFRPS
jgi:hypothetical protein